MLFHGQGIKIPTSLHPYPALDVVIGILASLVQNKSCALDIALLWLSALPVASGQKGLPELTGGKDLPTLVCISLITSEVQHLFLHAEGTFKFDFFKFSIHTLYLGCLALTE